MTPSKQTICLCMIVKNEASVISRCLASVLPLIDHWIVVDTGSDDGTQEIVRATMQNIPGEVIESPWIDFATNRTEALTLARSHADYLLIIDADDILEVPAAFVLPNLTADAYALNIAFDHVHYDRLQIVKSALDWRYVGVLHEFLHCSASFEGGTLPLRIRVTNDGARRRDPDTYRKDALVLEHALESETDILLRSRYTFYLARSYRDCGEDAKAIHNYLLRAEMGQWDQEIYVSLYDAGLLMTKIESDVDDILQVFSRATTICPDRVEAVHAASRLCREKGRYEEGFAIAEAAVETLKHVNRLFVIRWIYHYGLYDECAVNAFHLGRYRDGLKLALRALESGKVPPADQIRLYRNMRFAIDHIN